MEQLAPKYVLSLVVSPATKQKLQIVALNAAQASSLSSALLEDAKGSIFSALASIADALWGCQRGFYSWATVKLYYACFYLAKAALARQGLSVFYCGTSPCSLQALPGQMIEFVGGNSHSVVTSLYKKNFPKGRLVSQPIGSIDALDWITRRREEVNYKLQRFGDPDAPAWFKGVEKSGLRRAIAAYANDVSLYAYDEDHAIIALPIAALLEEKAKSTGFSSLGLTPQQVDYFRSRIADDKGSISSFAGALFD